jgi:hypothetical protein
MTDDEPWYRTIYRVPKGSESANEPVAGWWIECTLYGRTWKAGMEPAERRWYGPFDTMQAASDFRDSGFPLN